MALKTSDKPAATPAQPPFTQTTVLELALYKLYTWQNNTYEQGKPYRFRNEDAMLLLGEQDLGRQVWKLYQPPKKREAPKHEIVDATRVVATRPVEDVGFGTLNKASGRIEVGTDDEIQDILERNEEGGGDVTV